MEVPDHQNESRDGLAAGENRDSTGLDAKLGPFYDGPGLAARLRVSIDELAHLSNAREILCTPSADGADLYPSFQFGPAGEPLPELGQVLDALDPQRRDPWGAALWLRTGATRFEGLAAADLLRKGDVERVVAAAKRDHANWTQ
jgi:hypothetical protein